MKNIFLLVVIIIVNTSCVVNRMANPAVRPAELTNVKYFEPFSYIYLIEKGNQGILNDSLSMVSKLTLDSVIQNHRIMKVSGKIEIADTAQQMIIENEVAAIFQKIFQQQKLDGIKLTPTIRTVLEENNQHLIVMILSLI